jgi:hypothetical protein
VFDAHVSPPNLLLLLLLQVGEAVRGELALLQRCEVLGGPPADGQVMRWADHLLVQQAVSLPRWHAWQDAAGVVGLAGAVGTVRVRPATGPLFTVRAQLAAPYADCLALLVVRSLMKFIHEMFTGCL